MERWVSFGTPGELGNAVSRIGEFREVFGGDPGCRPYNQDKPDQSVWWYFQKRLSNWPAYHLGKYFFDKPQWVKVPRLRAGLSIEKGLGKEYADVFKKPRLQLNPKWTWYRFVAGLRGEPLRAALDAIAAKVPDGLSIEVRASATPPEHSLSERPARIRFDYRSGGALAATTVSEGKKQLTEIAKAQTLAALADALEVVTEEPAQWVDVMVYSDFACGQEHAPADAEEYTPREVWERLLAPLAPWVRE